jgi:hypothetical protein
VVILRPKAVNNLICSFEAIPIDACDPYRAAAGIYDLIVTRQYPVPCPRALLHVTKIEIMSSKTALGGIWLTERTHI